MEPEPRVDRIQFVPGLQAGNPFEQVARATNAAGLEGFRVSEVALGVSGEPLAPSIDVTYKRIPRSPSIFWTGLFAGVASGALLYLSHLLTTAIGTVFFLAVLGLSAFAVIRFLRGLEKEQARQHQEQIAEIEAWGKRMERNLFQPLGGNSHIN